MNFVTMLHMAPAVEECDATKMPQHSKAGIIKNSIMEQGNSGYILKYILYSVDVSIC